MESHDKSRLTEFKPNSAYFVGVDSDGCVFDNMGIKQEECFCPLMIGYFGLQPVARAARQCKVFADLYSKTRGANRHITIARILEELLPSHPLVKERAFSVPDFSHYCAWVRDPSSLLCHEGLREAISTAISDEAKRQLEQALAWSLRVDETGGALFYPIIPGREVESWVRLRDEAIGRLLSQTYAGLYQQSVFFSGDV